LKLLKTSYKIKPFIAILILLFLGCPNGISQNGFFLPANLERDNIRFELINNLVVIPVELNGTKLSFILDTGVNSTIVFSLSKEDSVQLKNSRTIRIRGLGEGTSINALKSENNSVRVGDARDINHTVYVIFDEKFNLSKKMGIPIHGIIGFDLFKNFVVKTNYNTKKITLYNHGDYTYKLCKKCQVIDMKIRENKPYINVIIDNEGKREEVSLLIDSGSSDAFWLFDEEKFLGTDSNKFFDDFLGQGLSGSIFGKRSKLDMVEIGDFQLKEVKVAYPEEVSFENVKILDGRDGSVGGDVLRRFTTIMDYASQKIVLKKNNKFNDPFYYNMSGLTVEHDGVVLVKEKQNSISSRLLTNENTNDDRVSIPLATVFNFYLAPRYIVSELRENSPAALAGIKKGDEILQVNGKPTYKYKLHELIALFSSQEGKKINLLVDTHGVISKRRFTLKKVF
jgi:hypothetical protein